MAHRTIRATITATIGALALAGGLLLAVPALALAPPGEVQEYPILSALGVARGITADADGDMWFTESVDFGAEGKIGQIAPSGLIISENPITNGKSKDLPERSEPNAIAVGPEGDLWFTDDGVTEEHFSLIGRINPADPKEIKEYPITTAPFAFPEAIVQGPSGTIWFTDGGIGKIGELNPAKPEEIKAYEVPTEKASKTLPEFSNPEGLALGSGGYLWFTNDGPNSEGHDFIGRINPANPAEIKQFALPTANSTPRAIVEGPEGNMWFVEAGTGKIGMVTFNGEFGKEDSVNNANYSVEGLALGRDRNFWFTQSEASNIARLTPAGELKTFPTLTPHSTPDPIAVGPEGNMWFAELSPDESHVYHIGELTTPYVPTNTAPPAISGTPMQGQALTASQGSWTNNPASFAYQWEACDSSGNNCTALSGETGVTHFLTAADVGHTLRIKVTATNIAGSTAAVSAPSAGVAAPPPPPPPPPPSVEASMTWTFGWSRKFTLVESLIVHGVPAGGHVEVTCHGHGCPFAHHRSATVARHESCHGRKCKKSKSKPKHTSHTGPEVSLTGLFKGRHLRVGASISVSVVKAGWVGKSFVFTMRSNETPRVQIDCLAPGSTSNPGHGC